MPAVAMTYDAGGQLNTALSSRARQNHEGQRNALVLKHAEMVRRIALHLADRLDGACGADDLTQSGLVGLLEAVDRYDSIEGIPFEAYAYPRIRGAMLDGLRRNDWCPRNARKQGRTIQAARAELQQTLGYEPAAREVAEYCDMPLEEYHRTEQTLKTAGMSSLESVLENGEGLLPADFDRTSAPVFEQNSKWALVEALKKLPEREQIIMSLYYDEEMNQKEIALALDLTEARISQLRSKAIKTLRRTLSEWM